MNSLNYYNSLLKNTFLDFKRNKIRTFLTSLGITVGVLAVVMLIALGLGLRNFISQQFQNLGSNLVVLAPGQGPVGGFSSLLAPVRFDESDVRTMKKVSGLEYVVPAFISNLRLESETENKIGTILATSEDYAVLFDLEFIEGQYFDRSDVVSAAKVGAMAETLATDLYGKPENAVGKTVKGKNMRIKIIGTFKNVGVPERDNAILVPYTTTFANINPKKEFIVIYTGVEDKDMVPEVKEDIENSFLKKYDKDEFEVVEPSDILNTLGQIFTIINAVLIALGSISLLVGGIGIMNIMYANVTERTKEIGIRRAIGAQKSDILAQFLTESTVLSLAGGLIGLGIAALLVLIIRQFFPVELNIIAVILAIGVSSLIGIFFGVFPARRAANLTPIEAIRD